MRSKRFSKLCAALTAAAWRAFDVFLVFALVVSMTPIFRNAQEFGQLPVALLFTFTAGISAFLLIRKTP